MTHSTSYLDKISSFQTSFPVKELRLASALRLMNTLMIDIEEDIEKKSDDNHISKLSHDIKEHSPEKTIILEKYIQRLLRTEAFDELLEHLEFEEDSTHSLLSFFNQHPLPEMNEYAFFAVAYVGEQVFNTFNQRLEEFQISTFVREEEKEKNNEEIHPEDNNANEKKLNTVNLLIAEEKQLEYESSHRVIHWISDESIAKIRNGAQSEKLSDKENAQRLDSYLNNLHQKKPIIDIPDYSIFEQVVKDSPHFKEVSDYYKGSFILNHFKMKSEEPYQAPLPLLLLGEPGIGKTYFAKQLANQLNTSVHLVDANSITANFVLTGGSKQWKSADAGLIFQQMVSSPTVSPIIIFDEIDKLSSGKNYDSFSTFHQLLEPENSQRLYDEFIECFFDASHIIYILTANDIQGIPDSLLSRMKVIDIKRPEKKDIHTISQNIYCSLIGKSGLFKPKLNKHQLEKIQSLSLREIKQVLTHSIFAQTANINMSDPDKVKLNQTLIIQELKTKKPFGLISNHR